MLNNGDGKIDRFKGDEEMAVLHKTVNNIQQICSIKQHITDIRVRLFEAINKLTIKERELEYITFNLEELSDEEIILLNMFHMMEDEQNSFAEGVAHISYEGLIVDEYKDGCDKKEEI